MRFNNNLNNVQTTIWKKTKKALKNVLQRRIIKFKVIVQCALTII